LGSEGLWVSMWWSLLNLLHGDRTIGGLRKPKGKMKNR